MSSMTVVRPVEVRAYQCDGPGCDEVCDQLGPPDGKGVSVHHSSPMYNDKYYHYHHRRDPSYPHEHRADLGEYGGYTAYEGATGCMWIGIPKETFTQRWNPGQSAWFFCSWRCAANWAALRSCEAGEIDCSDGVRTVAP